MGRIHPNRMGASQALQNRWGGGEAGVGMGVGSSWALVSEAVGSGGHVRDSGACFYSAIGFREVDGLVRCCMYRREGRKWRGRDGELMLESFLYVYVCI